MNRKILCVLLIILSVGIIGYLFIANYQLRGELREKERDLQRDKKTAVSYKKYSEIFDAMIEKLQVKDYTLKDGSLNPHFTVVEQDLTFGSGKVLSLSGEINGGLSDSTQNILIYENEKSKRQISVTFSFLKDELKSDMINCFVPGEFKKTTKLYSQCFTTINYNNIIILITQQALEKADMEDNFTFIRAIQKVIGEEDK